MEDYGVERRTLAIVRRLYCPPGVTPSRDSRLVEDLCIDDQRRLSFVLDLEREFTVDISDEISAGFVNLGSAIDFVRYLKRSET